MHPTGAHLAPLLSMLSSRLWGERVHTAPLRQAQVIILIEALKTLGYHPPMQVCITPYLGIDRLYGIELEPGALFTGNLQTGWEPAITRYLEMRSHIATQKPSRVIKAKIDPVFIFNLPSNEMDEVLEQVQHARELILDISGAQLEAHTEKVLGNKKMHRL